MLSAPDSPSDRKNHNGSLSHVMTGYNRQQIIGNRKQTLIGTHYSVYQLSSGQSWSGRHLRYSETTQLHRGRRVQHVSTQSCIHTVHMHARTLAYIVNR